jgi:hypothetical protein
MTDKAYAVPLHELLAGVPRNTRLEITDPDGYGTRFIPVGRYCHEAAEALRTALAQPEPEPVAWADTHDVEREGHDFHVSRQQPAKDGVPLYAASHGNEYERGFVAGMQKQMKSSVDRAVNAKREWVGLTKEEARKLCVANVPYVVDVVAALEAELKEKNGY